MSTAYVSNPVPKNTKTINDMISSGNTSVANRVKQLERRRRSITESSLNQDLNSSKDDPYNDAGMTSGYESNKSRRKKKYKSVSKNRNIASRKGLTNFSMNSKFKAPSNDFDPSSVNDGLNEIDLLIDQLENGAPEEIYEDEDLEVDTMMGSNRQLRDKIGEIAQFVMNAITKAAMLKKQIITHRDGPSDPGVKKKEKKIKNYQSQITRWKKYIKSLNIKLENSSEIDRINDEKGKKKILDKEISELESQILVLMKNFRHQQNTMNKLYDDPEFRFKMENVQKEIAHKKEEYKKLDEERKILRKEQDKVIKEMSKLNKEKFKLKEEKNNVKNGNKTTKMRKAQDAIDEINVIKNRMKLIEGLRDKKENKTKKSCQKKEKQVKDLEKMIKETKRRLGKVILDNEKMSQNLKNLKEMIPKAPPKKSNELNISKVELGRGDQSMIESKASLNQSKDLGIDTTIDQLKEKNILRPNIEDIDDSLEEQSDDGNIRGEKNNLSEEGDKMVTQGQNYGGGSDSEEGGDDRNGSERDGVIGSVN